MFYAEASERLSSLCGTVSSYGTARTRALLDELGSPDDALRIVHVAGTNGKGSVCAMLSAVLREAGHSTGVFTSPAVLSYAERFTVDGAPADAGVFSSSLEKVICALPRVAERGLGTPTLFEAETALALLVFKECGAEMCVLECGLGGTGDATNAVRHKQLAVVTSLGLDHTRELGSSISDIARAKAGIISGRAVCAPAPAEAASVLYPLCARVAAQPSDIRLSEEGTTFVLGGEKRFARLIGVHQALNASLVISAAELLSESGIALPKSAVDRGLARAVHRARLEVLRAGNIAQTPYKVSLSAGKTLILDGAHNPHGARALAESLRALYPGRRLAAVVGVLADKDAHGIAEALLPAPSRVVAVTPSSPRARSAESTADIFREEAEKAGIRCLVAAGEGVRRETERLLEEEDIVLVAGSLTLFRELA